MLFECILRGAGVRRNSSRACMLCDSEESQVLFLRRLDLSRIIMVIINAVHFFKQEASLCFFLLRYFGINRKHLYTAEDSGLLAVRTRVGILAHGFPHFCFFPPAASALLLLPPPPTRKRTLPCWLRTASGSCWGEPLSGT